jgi:hypothetical protein
LFYFVPPTFLLGWWVPDFLADISKYSFENQPAWTIQNLWTIPGILNLILSVTLMVLGLSPHGYASVGCFGIGIQLIIRPPHS